MQMNIITEHSQTFGQFLTLFNLHILVSYRAIDFDLMSYFMPVGRYLI